MAGTAIPVDRWRRDMFELGMLPVETERLLHVLSTDRTEATESLYDHAAYAVSLLRAEEHPAPKNLFMCFFWLLNALGQVDQWVSTSLEDIAVKHWTYAADFQRFAFVSPSTNCELIKGKCAEQTIHGYAKVAAILEVAAAGLRIQLSADSMEMLKELKAHGRILLPHTPR
jgi:hypothetical protein